MNATVRTTTPTSPLPRYSLDAISPRYAAVLARRNGLIEQLQALDAERRQLAVLIQAGKDHPPLSDRDRRRAELQGNSIDDAPRGDRDRLVQAEQDRGIVADMLAEADVELRDAHVEASKLACDLLAAEHRDLVRQMAAAMKAFHSAWMQQEAMLDRLRAAGVSYSSLRPESPDWAGRGPKVRADGLASWFRDLVRAGHVDRVELPEAYR